MTLSRCKEPVHSRQSFRSGRRDPYLRTKQVEAANKHPTKTSPICKAVARNTSDALRRLHASCTASQKQAAQMSDNKGAWSSGGVSSLPRNNSLETLSDLDLPHQDSPAARCIVTEATGVEDPSPIFIRDLFVQASQQKVAGATNGDMHQEQSLPGWDIMLPLPQVIVEQYQPGVNDFMTGVVCPAYQPLQTPAELAGLTHDDNNNTICNGTLACMDGTMPKMLFDRDAFARLNLLGLPEHISLLPEDFHITMAGIRVAFVEMFRAGGPRQYEDHELVAQLHMVGGRPKEAKIKILYPEDLVPIESGEHWGELHMKYWEQLRDLAEESARLE